MYWVTLVNPRSSIKSYFCLHRIGFISSSVSLLLFVLPIVRGPHAQHIHGHIPAPLLLHHFCCPLLKVGVELSHFWGLPVPSMALFLLVIHTFSTQSTELGSLCSSLVICFIHGSIYMPVILSQFIPPSSFPLHVHTSILYICVYIPAL